MAQNDGVLSSSTSVSRNGSIFIDAADVRRFHDGYAAEGAVLASWTFILANFELHLRKIFWVDEGLAWMLGATGLDVTGDALRPPFTSFALVFSDPASEPAPGSVRQ